MTVQSEGYPVAVSKGFAKILEQEIADSGVNAGDGVILNFRNPDYSPETGGYHPVEVMISDNGRIEYITDFSYAGSPPFAELVKEIDFDFSAGLFGHMGRDYPVHHGRGLFRTWQSNFCSYARSGIFQVTVSPC